VFLLRKDTFETLDKDSLAYRQLDLWRLPQADIAQVQIGRNKEEYTLKRDGDSWKISGPFDAAAETAQVRPLVEKLADTQAERYVAHTTKDLGQYGLDRPYLRIAVKTGAKKDASKNGGKDTGKEVSKDAGKDAAKDDAKERVLIVGKEVDKDKKARYARLGDGEAIFVLGEKVVEAVDHAALDLLDRKILTLDQADIQTIQSRQEKAGFTLRRDKDNWRVVDSLAPSFTADSQSVEETLRAWSGLKAKRFAAYLPKAKPADLATYGLDKPAVTVKATVKPAGDDKAKAVEHFLDLGAAVADSKGERYARLDSGPAIVVLDAGAADELARTYLDYVDRSALRFDRDKVSSLTRRSDSGALEIVKAKEGWKLLKPGDHKADQPTVDDLVAKLAELRAKRIAAYPAKDLEPYGLTKPVAEVAIALGEGKEKKEHRLQIGQPTAKGSAERFARVDKADAVIVLADDLAESLLAAPLQFRDRNLVKIKTPTSATLQRRFLTLVRNVVFQEFDGDWKMTQPLDVKVEESELQKLVQGVSQLRAGRLVTENPDLKAYGLDQPRAVWRFSIDGKSELTLKVGAMEKPGGKRAYAQLDKGPLVFLLDEPLTALALGEFRSREVWNNLDAVQVEKLRFGYAKDAFALEKLAGKWELAGKPGAKVNATAVSDALDAVARLKAELFVADKGADPKLFGLEPPALSLDIDTTAGKRTLLVGRQEGESGGYYAQVAGHPDAPIFIVGADTARKLVRPLQGFLETPEKTKKTNPEKTK
jgi:hypothetical protein